MKMDFLLQAALLASLIGAAAGASELAARYRDDPMRALFSSPAVLYLLFNGGAAFAATYLLVRFGGSSFSLDSTGRGDMFVLVMAAGFGSLAALRVSIVKLKVGNDEVSVGPALVIEQVLRIVDRGLDRHMAARRAKIADDLADKFVFATSGEQLVALCIVLLQNSTAEEQVSMGDMHRALVGSSLPDRARAISLVLALLGLVGEKVLRIAIDTVVNAPPPPVPAPAP